MSKPNGRFRGFTLVELLVIIAIIAILMSLLIPAISSARNKANTVRCLGQLKSWAGAVTDYQADNGGMFPTGSWYAVMAPYVGMKRQWEAGGTLPKPGDKSIYSCPSASIAEFGAANLKISYAMNSQVHVSSRTTGPIGVPTLRRSMLGKPGQFVVMFDSKSTSAYGGSADALMRHGRTNIVNILFADGRAISATNRLTDGSVGLLWNAEDAL